MQLSSRRYFSAAKPSGSATAAQNKEKLRAIQEKLRNEYQTPTFDALKSKRSGALALKVGMTRIIDAVSGKLFPVTVLQMEDVVVLQQRTVPINGYTAVQVGAGPVKLSRVNKPQVGEFVKANLPLKKHVQEFRCSPDGLLEVGTKIDVRHFAAGQKVDVCGITQGKGFQGVMKRWGFKGFPASHGASLVHRSAGSTGCRQDPGKVWPGKKMAGKMGNDRQTVQNVKIYAIDPARSLLFCVGQVPGQPGNYVRVTDAVKLPMQFRELNLSVPFPTFKGDKFVLPEGQESGPANWIMAQASLEAMAAAKLAEETKKPAAGKA